MAEGAGQNAPDEEGERGRERQTVRVLASALAHASLTALERARSFGFWKLLRSSSFEKVIMFLSLSLLRSYSLSLWDLNSSLSALS